MRALVLFLLLPPLLLAALHPAAAAEESARHDSITTALQSIGPGKTVRLALLDPAQARYEGTFERFVADSLHLARRDAVGGRVFPADSLRTVWVQGNAAPLCAVVLGATAAVGMAAVGSSLESGFGFGGSGSSGGGTVLVAGLGGAVLGYVIGLAIPTWSQRYPKEEKSGPSRD